MKITSRGKYALQVMVDIAEQKTDGYIKLDDIAKRQDISEKYLEGIIASLSKEGLLLAVRGKGGGYKLASDASKCTVGSVLKITEGSLAPVKCLDGEENGCSSAKKCKTLPMWRELDKIIDDYLESVTIDDLVRGNVEREILTIPIDKVG
ncbi:MAG: Rrf2 family transcriptional regulator [Clostridia bacterium]|nr:Rrf2 family transcriptional regulator [Clostridia bacterium]